MARKNPVPEPSAFVRSQRPTQAPDVNRSNYRVDELDAHLAWEVSVRSRRGQFDHGTHIDAGRIKVG